MGIPLCAQRPGARSWCRCLLSALSTRTLQSGRWPRLHQGVSQHDGRTIQVRRVVSGRCGSRRWPIDSRAVSTYQGVGGTAGKWIDSDARMLGKQLSFVGTDLETLYPVTLDPSQPRGWGSRTAAQLELTRAGRRSLLTRLEDSEDGNAALWNRCPDFSGTRLCNAPK